MQIVSARSALLSNVEVLALLRAADTAHVAQQRVKRADGPPTTYAAPGAVPDSLRTVELEAIQYLSAAYQPTARQTPEATTTLVRALAPYALTKAEKLQVANLAPTEPVELYVIVEELEDRFGEQMDDVLTLVRASLSDAPVGGEGSGQGGPHARDAQGEPDERWAHEDDAAEQELVFDDDGAGAGVEGDLDMEDD